MELFKKRNNYHSLSLVVLVVILSLVSGTLAGVIAGTLTAKQISSQKLPPVVNSKQPVYQPVVNSEEGTVVEAVEKVQPSVVSIVVTKELEQYSGGSPFFFNIPGWPQFEFEQPGEVKKEKREVGGGTGFIISSDGLILTNKHVVADSEAEYTVILNEGETKYEAKVLAVDPFNDIAVIKIETQDLPAVVLGDSDQVRIGQTVIAIGNALSEFPNTVTKGVVSGIGRQITAGSGFGQTETLRNVIQTDAAINPGNSGGPLINLEGEVIGINTAISQAGQSIGFAIPINEAKKAVTSVKTHGKIIRPCLGIRYVLVDQEIAEQNKLPVDYGALIVRGQTTTELAVMPGSPADKAGLRENDIILEINGTKIDVNNDLARLIAQHDPGDEIELKILRAGEEKIVTAVLVEYEE